MSENTERRYLKWYNKIGYGSGDIAGNVVYAFLSSFVMIYLTDTIGLKGSPTNIYKSFTPPRKGSGMMLEGSGRETVEQLFGILSAKHII